MSQYDASIAMVFVSDRSYSDNNYMQLAGSTYAYVACSHTVHQQVIQNQYTSYTLHTSQQATVT